MEWKTGYLALVDRETEDLLAESNIIKVSSDRYMLIHPTHGKYKAALILSHDRIRSGDLYLHGDRIRVFNGGDDSSVQQYKKVLVEPMYFPLHLRKRFISGNINLGDEVEVGYNNDLIRLVDGEAIIKTNNIVDPESYLRHLAYIKYPTDEDRREIYLSALIDAHHVENRIEKESLHVTVTGCRSCPFADYTEGHCEAMQFDVQNLGSDHMRSDFFAAYASDVGEPIWCPLRNKQIHVHLENK